MQRNRNRREKLGDLCFELAKYTLTAIVIGWFIEPEITPIVFSLGVVLSIAFLITGYYLVPLDKIEVKNE